MLDRVSYPPRQRPRRGAPGLALSPASRVEPTSRASVEHCERPASCLRPRRRSSVRAAPVEPRATAVSGFATPSTPRQRLPSSARHVERQARQRPPKPTVEPHRSPRRTHSRMLAFRPTRPIRYRQSPQFLAFKATFTYSLTSYSL
jgi:hypothetical protein